MTTQKKQKGKLVPILRFKGFDGGWKLTKLGEICNNFKSGESITSKDIFDSGEFPVYGGNGLRGYTNKNTHEGFYVLIGRQGALCGNINRVYGKTFISEHAIAVDANETSDTEWIAQKLAFINLNRLSESSAQPGLAVNKLLKLKLHLPTLPEQQKISSFLSSVDEKLSQLTRKKELLAQYKKGVMQQLFSGKLRFKDENGKEFKKWEEKRLGNLTYKVGKKNKENIKYPVYSINNKEGFLPQSEQFEGLDSVDRGYDISNYKIINKHTFAYNPARINVGSIGYSYELNEVLISSLYVCFKTEKELEDSYLLAYLSTYNFNKDILRFEEGGVRQYLFYENFSHIKIPLPSNKEQQKISTFLSSIDLKISAITAQISQTQSFKKGLLQQMFV